MTDREHTIEYVALEDLRRAPRNPKGHRLEEIHRSFGRFGFVQPLLVNESTGTLLAGHGRLDTLEEQRTNGEQPPEGIRVAADGTWHVPVIRGVSFDDDAEAEAYLIADNRLTEIGGWRDDELAPILQGFVERDALAGTGFGTDDVRALLKRLDGDRKTGRTDADAIPQPPGDPITQTGDLWKLGPHRVLCGDSTKSDEVDRLVDSVANVKMVLTDPPFAIYGSATGIASDIADDKMVRPFFESMLRTAARVLPWFAHVYVHCDWRSWPAIWDAASRAELSPKNCIVWDKGDGGLGTSYANTYELVAFMAKLPPDGVTMRGVAKQARVGQRQVHRPNLIRGITRVRGTERLHNAAKPVTLLEEFINNSSDEGDAVLDLFGGSGSTLMACERVGRAAAVMEISPKWCDVIVRRWEEFTGRKAVKA